MAARYTGGMEAMPQSGPGARGTKPPEYENNLKTNCAILRSGFDYLNFRCFKIFRTSLLNCYWPIPMPLM